MKLIVKQIVDDYKGVRHTAPIIVFVPNERPFDQGDFYDFYEDFIWRRTHKMLYAKEEILDAVRDVVIRAGYFIKRISYSRYAGCGTCPCSPGYIIHTDRKSTRHYEPRMAIYLECKNLNKGAILND